MRWLSEEDDFQVSRPVLPVLTLAELGTSDGTNGRWTDLVECQAGVLGRRSRP